jgi:hypothetical protein
LFLAFRTCHTCTLIIFSAAAVKIPEYPIPEYLIPEYPIPEYPIPEYLISEYPIPEYPIPEYPIPEYPITEYPIPEYPNSRISYSRIVNSRIANSRSDVMLKSFTTFNLLEFIYIFLLKSACIAFNCYFIGPIINIIINC